MLDCRDRTTVDDLYRRLGPVAVSKTQRLTGRWDIAEEVVQEVFLKLWRDRLSFPNLKAVYAWIFRSCHHAGIDYLRSARRRLETNVDGIDTVAGEHQPQDLVCARQMLVAILSRFKDQDIKIFAYYHMDRMTQQEVAEFMDISRKTVERALQRCESGLTEVRRLARRG